MIDKRKVYAFFLINISIGGMVHADLISFLKNSAQSKEVWLGAAIATTAWGVHKLYADKFSKSLQEDISYKKSEIYNHKATEGFINLYIAPIALADAQSYSFKGSNGKAIELELDPLKERLDIGKISAIKSIVITKKLSEVKNRRIAFVKTLDNEWHFTEIEQEKKVEMVMGHDQTKANRFHLARNIGMATGLGISLWGAYLHGK